METIPPCSLHAPVALALAVLALPACTGPVAPAGVEPVPSSSALSPQSSVDLAAQVSADLAAQDSCDGSGPRWIGTDSFTGACADPASGCACPSAPGWIATRTFAVIPAGSTKPAPIPPALSPYCLYAWGGADPVDATAISVLHQALDAEIEGLTEDCVVVAPHAHPVNDLLRPWLREQFREAEGGAGPLPRGAIDPATVEIAVLDSSPLDASGSLPRGRFDHGYLVGWIGRDLTCDALSVAGTPACFGLISTYLALPYLDERTVDVVNGGSFGTRSGLAREIFRAVETWKLRTATAPRLVIPLSVGWDPGFADPLDPASRAVHDALVHAACHGAFVAAAAGNDTGGPSPGSGPLYPAAWESEIAPDASVCPALEGVAKVADLIPGYAYDILPAPGGLGAPLVLSIAGVDHASAPIDVTRPGSVTALAALAFQGDAGDPASELPLPHTGTSIAAAVAGGAAASVWAYDPALTAPEVIAALRATATPLSTFATDQCANSKCAVSRLSVASARAYACAGPSAYANPRCPAVKGPLKPGPKSNPIWPPAIQSALFAYFAPAHVTTPVSVPASPFELVPSASVPWWVLPQPPEMGCTVCGYFKLSRAAYVELSLDYAPVTHVTLTLSGGSMRRTSFEIAPSMKPGEALIGALGGAVSTPSTASLSWIVRSTGASVTQQIAVN